MQGQGQEHEPAAEPRIERIRETDRGRLAALVLGAGPHLEELLDVGTAPNGDLLLHLPRPAGRATDLLAVPGWPTRGESVTLLVPLAAALERMHVAGVAHGGVAASSVVLDAEGAPALTAPVSPVLEGAAGGSAFAAAVADDLARYRELVVAVVGRTGQVPALPRAEDLAGTVDALFALAEPVPIRLAPVAPLAADPVPTRLVVPLADPAAVPRGEGPLRVRATAAMRALGAVRRRVWAVAGTAVVLLAAAVVLLPGADADAVPPRAARTTPPAASAPPRAEAVQPSTDPEAALRELLAIRARCLARDDAGCLAGIESPASPIAREDTAALASGAEPVPADPRRMRLLSTAGGTATARVGGSTVLAVREPDGWRLRDVVGPPPAVADRTP